MCPNPAFFSDEQAKQTQQKLRLGRSNLLSK